MLEIDILGAELGFVEPAAEVGADLEDGEHPRGSASECGSGGGEVLGGELFFRLGRSAGDLGKCEGIPLGDLAAERLLHDEGEELQLEPGGIVRGALGFAPIHKVGGVLVSDLGGVADIALAHPLAASLPGELISFLRVGIGEMGLEVCSGPLGECAVHRSGLGLLLAGLLGHALGSSGVLGIIDAAAGGDLAPTAGLEIAEFQNPKSGLRRGSEKGHV